MAAYQNAYRATLNTEDDPQTNDDEATLNLDPTKATPDDAPVISVEEATYKGRYDSLKMHYDKTVNDLRGKINELSNQMQNSKEISSLPKTPEELQAWRKEYPDVYDIIKTVSRMEATDERKAIDAKLVELGTIARQTQREKAEAVLLRYHPDFDVLRADPAFHAWAKEQPGQIQSWLYENEDDPLLAAKAVDLYKAEKGIKRATKADSKADARNASLTVTKAPQAPADRTDDGKRIWKSSEVRKLTPRQFEKLEDEIDAAIREERFIQDE